MTAAARIYSVDASTKAAREAARDRATGQFGEQPLADPGRGVLDVAAATPEMTVQDRLAAWLGGDKVAHALVEPDSSVTRSQLAASDLVADLADTYRADPQMAELMRDVEEWLDQRRKLDDQLDNTTSDSGIDHDGWLTSDEEAARLCRQFGAWLDIKPVFPARLGPDQEVCDTDGLLAGVPGNHVGDGWYELVDENDGQITVWMDGNDRRRTAARAALQVARVTQLGKWANQRWDAKQLAFIIVPSADRGEALAQAGWDGCIRQGQSGDGWFEMVNADDPRQTVSIFEAKGPVQ